MEVLLNDEKIDVSEITDFMSEEQRTYFSQKLLEGEEHDRANPKVYTFDEFQRKIKEKYGI